MSIEAYVVFAVLLIGWYVVSKDDNKEKKVEVQEVKTLDEILRDTEVMCEYSTEKICEMFKNSRKEISNIHKSFTRELRSNHKITKQGE